MKTLIIIITLFLQTCNVPYSTGTVDQINGNIVTIHGKYGSFDLSIDEMPVGVKESDRLIFTKDSIYIDNVGVESIENKMNQLRTQ